jgi:uncharacterized membrane protein
MPIFVIPGDIKDWYQYIFLFFTVLMFSTYAYVYIGSQREYGNKYIPIIVTARTLILASFLIFFYNPLRATFEYGRSMPTFAFAAGISLLLLTDKYQVLNLVHYCLYGELLPQKPKKICKLVDAAGYEIDKKDEQKIQIPVKI